MGNYDIIKDTPIPAYYQIKMDLIHRIMQKEWDIFTQIPSEETLAKEYNVSRVTLRQALAELEKDGIIKKYRGKGAFVNSNPTPFVHELNYATVSSDQMLSKDKPITAILLKREIVTNLYDEIADNLELSKDDSVIYVKRLFFLDKKPIAISRSWLPTSLVPHLDDLENNNTSLSTTLAKSFNLTPVKINDYLEVVRPTISNRKLLKCSYDAPLILIKGLSILENNQKLEYSNTLWLGDSIRFHFSLFNSTETNQSIQRFDSETIQK